MLAALRRQAQTQAQAHATECQCRHLRRGAIGSVELGVAEMRLEQVLEATELHLALVPHAEGECLLGRFLRATPQSDTRC